MVADCCPLVPVTVKFVGFAELGVRPVTVSVLDPPGGTADGENVQVAPLLHDNPMVPRNVLGAEAETAKFAVLDPIVTTLDL
jgi:hypothetical protein